MERIHNMAWLFFLVFVTVRASDVDPVKFLQDFGYISPFAYASDMPSAISRMQAFAGIPVTGKLDNATLAKMKAPRCGRPDVEAHAGFSGTLYKWSKTHLTYSFQTFCKDLTQDQCKFIIRSAFMMWERSTPLRFTEVVGKSDLVMHFEARHHGDIYPFDGPGNVLAHAFYPPDGRAHFDEDEYFVAQGGSGTDLFWVAAHEFGHSLGLEHTNNKDALMYPYHKHFSDRTNLPNDDCKRIQAIYGVGGRSCGGTTTGGGVCEDRKEHASSCNWWKGQGYCNPSSQYFASMKTFCTKTCGFCR